MPKVSTTLSMVSILIVLVSQAFARNPSLIKQISGFDAFFAFVMMFCATGILTSWLGRPVSQKQEEDLPVVRKKEDKKDQAN